MNWKRLTGRAITEANSLVLKKNRRAGFRVLLYHSVGSRLKHDNYGISIAPRLFARHMEILAARPQTIITAFCKPQSSQTHLRVAVTFDDGYKDNLHVAAPILLKLKIPFTIFVTASFIKSRAAEFLTPAELRELSMLPNVTIGAHGATHSLLAACDDATLRRELEDSRRYIEDVTGKPVTAISYPHGSVDRRVRDAAARAGYVVGGCSRFDINDEKRDPLLLCRCEIVAADGERVFQQKLEGAWDWCKWRSPDPAKT